MFQDKNRSIKERAVALAVKMSLEEKIAQLQNVAPAIPRLGLEQYNYWGEASHGITNANRDHQMDVSSFPACIALSNTWNKTLIRDVASAIADEVRAYHNTDGDELHAWCPTINLARDPRWGRNDESFGEDPFLAGKLAAAYIRGIQGNDSAYLKAVATPKHFAMNNSECDRHGGSSYADEATLREYYAKVFEYAVKDGKPFSLMTSYNSVNGIPSSANTFLLQHLLREEWGFEGFVVSDCGAVGDAYVNPFSVRSGHPRGHFYAKCIEEAAALCLGAGTDMTGGVEYEAGLGGALQRGFIAESDIDRAVVRVLETRIALGMLDDDGGPYHTMGKADVCTQRSLELTRQSAAESIVLLKNENNILPFDLKKIKKLAVIGPNAIYRQMGGYSCGGDSSQSGLVDTLSYVTPLDGIKALALENGISVEYTKGWNLTIRKNAYAASFLPGQEAPTAMAAKEYFDSVKALLAHGPRRPVSDAELGESDETLLEKALNIAGGADAVIIITGTDRSTAREDNDRKTLVLPYGQDEKIQDILKKNPNTAVVCISLGPVCGGFIDKAPALAAAYFGGQEQGTAIAGVLFGLASPSGRLSQSWYTADNDLPHITQYTLRPQETETGKGRTYQYYTDRFQFPFGFGLSYTNFEYGALTLEVPGTNAEGITPLNAGSDIHVSVPVKNTGTIASHEVVQLYLSKQNDEGLYDNKPLRQLKGFEKIWLEPAEEKTVHFCIPPGDYSFWNVRLGRYVAEPGIYTLTAAKSSAAEDVVSSVQFKLSGEWHAPLETISVTPEKLLLKTGETSALRVTAVCSDTSRIALHDCNVKFTSSDEKVAKVNGDGIVRAETPGIVTISVTVSLETVDIGITRSCALAVTG
ncbi:MAG: glycoside hydrolase family 3 C-terminal domain-containing protein [Treponema sp.]|nr:glycoside hydrolase family 3 C-terminal domain-containing protein [Treponema sp.]